MVNLIDFMLCINTLWISFDVYAKVTQGSKSGWADSSNAVTLQHFPSKFV